MRRFVIVLIGTALLVAAATADQAEDGKKSKNAGELWAHLKDNLISAIPGLRSIHSRQRRNNFGDLPVKCGPNQEKIHGECQDV